MPIIKTYRVAFLAAILLLAHLVHGQEFGPGDSMEIDNTGIPIASDFVPASLNNAVNQNSQNNLNSVQDTPATSYEAPPSQMDTPIDDNSFDNVSGGGESMGADDNGNVSTEVDIPAELDSATDPDVQEGLNESQEIAAEGLANEAAQDETATEDTTEEEGTTEEEATEEETTEEEATEEEATDEEATEEEMTEGEGTEEDTETDETTTEEATTEEGVDTTEEVNTGDETTTTDDTTTSPETTDINSVVNSVNDSVENTADNANEENQQTAIQDDILESQTLGEGSPN